MASQYKTLLLLVKQVCSIYLKGNIHLKKYQLLKDMMQQKHSHLRLLMKILLLLLVLLSKLVQVIKVIRFTSLILVMKKLLSMIQMVKKMESQDIVSMKQNFLLILQNILTMGFPIVEQASKMALQLINTWVDHVIQKMKIAQMLLKLLFGMVLDKIQIMFKRNMAYQMMNCTGLPSVPFGTILIQVHLIQGLLMNLNLSDMLTMKYCKML